MWLALAFFSAFLLGFYDTSKKVALKDNAVLPVLLVNTVICAVLFSPFLVTTSISGEEMTLHNHLLLIGKACLVLTSWIFGYIGLKHLPITVVGPINASRPMMVLVGAMVVFGERLNAWQWAGVLLAFASILMLSLSSRRKEAVDMRWLWCTIAAAVFGAASGLYDKFVMGQMSTLFVQSWNNLYQAIAMTLLCAVLRWIPRRRAAGADAPQFTPDPFHWSWAIPLISIFISAADFCYYTSLADPDSMISIVSLVRRSSVIVSFVCGVIIFRERRNIPTKILDLSMVLIGMVFIWLGSR